MSRGGDRGKVHTRDGQEAVSRCLASGSSDRTVQLWDWAPPVQSAPRRLVTPTSSSRWGSAPAVASSQAAGISPCGCGTCHSLSSCCPGSADLRAGPAGSSYLTQTTQVCFQTPRLPLPVRLLVNRCCSRRSSGHAHGPDLRLAPHCQAWKRSLTRKRSLVQIQYRPPVSHLVRARSLARKPSPGRGSRDGCLPKPRLLALAPR